MLRNKADTNAMMEPSPNPILSALKAASCL